MSLRGWLLLALAYVLVLAIVALEVPTALNLRDRVNAEVRSQAAGQADVVAASAADLLARRDRGSLDALAGRAADAARGRVIVVDRRGRVLSDSAGTGAVGASYAGRPEVAAALRGKAEQQTRHSRTLHADLLATAVPIVRNGRPAGAVRVTQSVAAVQSATRDAILGLALIGLLVLALGCLAGLVIARSVARPLHRLDAATRRIANGDLEARAVVEGSQEQRSLARSFNDMTARLARLVRSQREFVADASHQLRTPLTAVRLRLEESRNESDNPVLAEDLDAALDEVDRLARIVDELLVLSRAGERDQAGEQVDVTLALQRAAERWEPAAAAAGLALDVQRVGADDAWMASADLDRVIDALVENAISYSPPGRSIELAAGSGWLAVRDRGAGLEPGEEESLFDRFRRGRAGREGPAGTGLGLAIARELCAAWGATVRLAARPGGGAVARVELPVPATKRERVPA
jgi:two-component system, OmpR family, sensor kinase